MKGSLERVTGHDALRYLRRAFISSQPTKQAQPSWFSPKCFHEVLPWAVPLLCCAAYLRCRCATTH